MRRIWKIIRFFVPSPVEAFKPSEWRQSNLHEICPMGCTREMGCAQMSNNPETIIRPMDTAPRDGTPFWGVVGKETFDAIRMLWHDGFGAFVSSWRRMTMAPGYTINGKPHEDHSPVIHNPVGWLPLPKDFE